MTRRSEQRDAESEELVVSSEASMAGSQLLVVSSCSTGANCAGSPKGSAMASLLPCIIASHHVHQQLHPPPMIQAHVLHVWRILSSHPGVPDGDCSKVEPQNSPHGCVSDFPLNKPLQGHLHKRHTHVINSRCQRQPARIEQILRTNFNLRLQPRLCCWRNCRPANSQRN